MSDYIPIFFSTDHNFVIPTTIAIFSLLKSAGESKYDIYVLTGEGVTDRDKEKIRNQVYIFKNIAKLSFIDLKNELKEAYTTDYFTTPTYYRLLIPWIAPQFDKVIYSDADIIFNGSLKEIFNNIDLTDYYVAGVNRTCYLNGAHNEYIKSIDLNPEEYINAGFIILNSKLMREHNLKSKFLKLIHKKFKLLDQDIINTVCKGKIVHLSKCYNSSTEDILEGQIKNYMVFHFFNSKPWKEFSLMWIEWWELYKASSVYDSEYYLKTIKKIYCSTKNNLKIYPKSIIEGTSTRRKIIRSIERHIKNKLLKLKIKIYHTLFSNN